MVKWRLTTTGTNHLYVFMIFAIHWAIMHMTLFILNATLWGFSFVAIRYVVDDIPPIFGACMRVAIALATLLIIAGVTRRSFALPHTLRWKVWIAGLFLQAIPFALIYWGEQVVSAGLTGIINGTLPLWTFLLGLIFFRQYESYSWQQFAGLVFGFIGICIIFVPFVQTPELHTQLWGIAAIIGMVLCYAIGTLLNRYFFADVKGLNLFGSVMHQHFSSSIFLIVVTLLIEGEFPLQKLVATPSAFWATLYLGIGSTAVAWLCFLTLIKEWGAVRASAVTYCVPLIALITDWLFFGTLQPLTVLLGAVIVFTSILMLHRSR
jgi:drug/metabolite transporter (DMT)-like permease